MSSSSTLLGVVAQLRQVQRLELLLNAPLSRCGMTSSAPDHWQKIVGAALQCLNAFIHAFIADQGGHGGSSAVVLLKARSSWSAALLPGDQAE
jgi:hypothetical protein